MIKFVVIAILIIALLILGIKYFPKLGNAITTFIFGPDQHETELQDRFLEQSADLDEHKDLIERLKSLSAINGYTEVFKEIEEFEQPQNSD